LSDPNDRAFWRGKRALITGHAGFVGSNLVAALLDLASLPSGVDLLLSSPSLQALGANCPVNVADVRDRTALLRVLRDVRPEIVFHLAGIGHIAECEAVPYQAFAINAMGTVAVLEAVRRVVPEAAVVVASSNEVYPAGGPWREDQTPEPRTLYGWTKLAQDQAARAYGQRVGLKTAALRHANAIGAANPHGTHLSQSIITALLGGKRTVALRSDGTPRKAYLSCDDVCSAYLCLAEGLMTGRITSGQAWNAGSNETPSVIDVAEALIGLSGLSVTVELDHDAPAESSYWQGLDSRRLEALGWSPRPLKEALAQTWAWYQKMGGMAWLNG
jgi:CDP-glucose 4,6-dehydratase